MPADTSYANRFKRLSGLTISNFRLSQPNLQPAAIVDNTYYTKSNVSNAAPINIVRNVVQDFNDPRLFTASVSQSAVVPVIPDPVGTVYMEFVPSNATGATALGGYAFTKSIDNGLTWSVPVYINGSALTGGGTTSYAPVKYGSNLFVEVFIASAFGPRTFMSSDYGNTWSIIQYTDNLGGTVGDNIAVVENVYFKRSSVINNISRSIDGTTWTRIPNSILSISNIKSVGGGKFIACGYNGTSPNINAVISISTDYGVTWGSPITFATNSSPLTRVSDIAIVGTKLFAILISVASGNASLSQSIYTSTDGGTTWSNSYTIQSYTPYTTNTFVVNIVVSGTNIIICYVDASSSIAYALTSTNSGTSWLSPVALGASRSHTYNNLLVKSGANLVASLLNGVSVSTDNGITWSFISTPKTAESIYSAPGTLFVNTG